MSKQIGVKRFVVPKNPKPPPKVRSYIPVNAMNTIVAEMKAIREDSNTKMRRLKEDI